MKADISRTPAHVDLLLRGKSGHPVSLVEIKSYRKPTQDIKEQTIAQLGDYAQRLGRPPELRYFTILSTATGYIQDIQTNKTVEFSTENIIKDYLPEPGMLNLINTEVLTSVFSTWLNDLSMGTRKLTQDEKKLKDFGFIDTIRGTSSQTEYEII